MEISTRPIPHALLQWPPDEMNETFASPAQQFQKTGTDRGEHLASEAEVLDYRSEFGHGFHDE